MFYEVRILDSKNRIKKIIPTKELSRRHWNNFENYQEKQTLPEVKKNRINKSLYVTSDFLI